MSMTTIRVEDTKQTIASSHALDLMELVKPRISAMVLVTVALSVFVASRRQSRSIASATYASGNRTCRGKFRRVQPVARTRQRRENGANRRQAASRRTPRRW